jgi:putative transferase (TIGR04331 family)
VKRFLITTALESTWCENEPVLFLGEWCRRYSRKNRWSTLDSVVLLYHWNDSTQFHADYEYLKVFHERLLQDLTVQLNEIHGVDHSLRYWRILIGPWLGYFVQVLFDRWTSIQQAVSRYDLSGTAVLTSQDGPLVPNDMDDFNQLYIEDAWNHEQYAYILQRFTEVPCIVRVQQAIDAGSDLRPTAIRWKQRVKQTLMAGYARAAAILSRDRDVFLMHTRLRFRDEMALYRRLGQFPQIWRSVPAVRVAVDDNRRQWVVDGEDRSDFEACARTLIPRQIPAVYMEGYQRLVQQTRDLSWPKKPKLIWTSMAFSADDVFKAWAGDKVEKGSRLVIAQHGGHYGMGRCSFPEDHEIGISDSYLTWGWDDKEQPQVKPVGQLKAWRPLGIRHTEQPRALLVTVAVPRQSVPMFSATMSSQWLDYFSDQCAFVEALPARIQHALTVRLHAPDRGWDQAARWRDRFPMLQLDDGHSIMADLIRQTRLYIATYNATTYLESLSLEVPTVIFWNPHHWELRDSAIPYFDDLKRVAIFHDNPDSAARHVSAIWDDVDTWWASPSVQDAVGKFMGRYCQQRDDLLDQVEAALRTTMVRSQPRQERGFPISDSF